MKDRLVKTGYALLNGVVFLVFLWSLMIFTSGIKMVPWHESSGMQFMAIIIITAPVLAIIGSIILIYGKWIGASIINRGLSLVGMVLLVVITVAGSDLDLWMKVTGAIVCIVCALLALITTIRDLSAIGCPIQYQRIAK